jgi:hypothetical protein
MAGQRLRRAHLEERQIRGGLPEGLCLSKSTVLAAVAGPVTLATKRFPMGM